MSSDPTSSARHSKEHEALVDALLESSFDAVLVFKEGEVARANEGAASALGFDAPEALRGLRPEELAALSSREALQKALRICPSEPVSLELQRRGGSSFEALVRCEATSGGRSLRVVTLRAQERPVQASPEAKAAHLEALLEHTPDAVITTDRSGVIREWNRGAQAIFGYNRAEVYGRPLEIIMPERYKKGHQEGMRRVERGGEKHVIGRTVQMEGLRKEGEEFPLELTLLEWEADDTTYYTGIIRDLTRRSQRPETIVGDVDEGGG